MSLMSGLRVRTKAVKERTCYIKAENISMWNKMYAFAV